MPIYHHPDIHRLGKRPRRDDPRTLKLSRYTKALAPAPPTCDWSLKLSDLGPMLNTSIGDCTCAAVGHMIQTWTANTGKEVIIPDQDILRLYEVFGYVPGNPATDQGAVEIDVLNYWRANPVDGHQLLAYAALNPQQTEEIRQSVYYFGGAYIGLALPITAQTQDIWTVTSLSGDGTPGSWGGHAVPVIGYDRHYVKLITWGQIKLCSWNFFYAYTDEAYALLSPDWMSEGKTPNGFDLEQLTSDLMNIA
jgi:hypothetical protein